MTFTVHTITRISPATRTARDRTRAGHSDDSYVVESESGATQAETSIAKMPMVHSQARSEKPPARPDISGSLAAQLIAQKSPGKSDRRLARYFPERINAAYREVAQSAAGPRKIAQKQV